MKTKTSILGIILSSISIAFFFCAFIPINGYIGNAQEYPFVAVPTLLSYAFLNSVLAGIGTAAFLYLVHKAFPRVFPQLLAILIGISLALYAQGNLINLDYGVLDGHEIQWGAMRKAGILNTCVFAAVLVALPIFAFIKRESAVPILNRASALFLAFQILVTGMNLFKCDFQAQPVKSFDLTGMEEISKDGGVYVIIFDSFDAPMMNSYLEKHPETRNALSDFTYYDNVIGRFSYTSLAVPHIITGVAYNDGMEENNRARYLQYKNRAYASSEVLRKACEKGMKIGIYTGASLMPSEIDPDMISHMVNINADAGETNKGRFSMRPIYDGSVFIYLPHFLKQFSDKLKMVDDTKSSNKLAIGYKMTQRHFNKLLETNGFELSEGRSLKFLHFYGVHLPGYNMENAEYSMSLLLRFIDVLKRNNVYKQSKIIVMGDHGVANREHPIVLHNNAQSSFAIDKGPRSYDDFSTFLLRAMENDEPASVDFPEHEGNRLYVYYGHVSKDSGFLSNYYDRAGSAVRDVFAKRVYSHSDQLPSVGIEWDNTKKVGAFWTLGKTSSLSIPVVPELLGKRTFVNFQTKALLSEKKPEQKMQMFFNGEQVGEYVYKYPHTTKKLITVPLSASANTSSCLRVDFHIDDPSPPLAFIEGSKDPHPYGIGISGISFEDQYYLAEGFSSFKASCSWSAGDVAEICCFVPETLVGNDVICEISMSPYVVPGKRNSQTVKMFVEDEMVYEKTVSSPEWRRHAFTVRNDYIKDGMFKLKLVFPDAVSPHELKEEDDDFRKLGFCVSSVRFTTEEDEMKNGVRFSGIPEKWGRLISGFSHPEYDGVWSMGAESTMQLYAPDFTDVCRYSITARPFLNGKRLPFQKVRILASGLEVFNGRLDDPSDSEMSFEIPRKAVANGWVDIKIETPNAESPASLGINGDSRKLALFLRSYRIESAK